MDYEELGKRIVQLRKQAGYSQTTLAQYSGISRATIAGFETGRATDLGTRKLIKLLAILGHELSIREASPRPTFEEILSAQSD
jgi:transcriptional regulator with XRE-family HTH domain